MDEGSAEDEGELDRPEGGASCTATAAGRAAAAGGMADEAALGRWVSTRSECSSSDLE